MIILCVKDHMHCNFYRPHSLTAWRNLEELEQRFFELPLFYLKLLHHRVCSKIYVRTKAFYITWTSNKKIQFQDSLCEWIDCLILETASFTIMLENLTGQNSGVYIVRLSAQTLFRDYSFEKNLKAAKKGKNKYRNTLSFS